MFLPKIKHYLLFISLVLLFFLIVFSNLKVLPLKTGDFVFFAFLVLAFALYRPGWAFLFFASSITLENINLAPQGFPLSLRPYQFLAALIGLALLIRFFTKRINFTLPKIHWFDFLPIILLLSSFLSAFFSTDKGSSLKLSVVLGSFVFIYFLTRIYLQSLTDVKRILPFILGSGSIIVVYGLWQNIRFLLNKNSFEIMPGRPNATFTEPDWLGMYLVVLIGLIISLVYFHHNRRTDEKSELLSDLETQDSKFKISKIFVFVFLTLTFSLTVITVSRSAWLGTLAGIFIFLWIVWTNLNTKTATWNFKETVKIKIFIISSLAIALALVYVFHLTNFQLWSRVASTGGLQKITISCTSNIAVPENIINLTELEKYNCRHINLEEIGSEKSAGHIVKEISRPDPNFNVRKEIYQKSWETIKKHSMLGIGWGSTGKLLGLDNRGASLNSSNIFLEIYLGSGLLGFLAFTIFWFYIPLNAIRNFGRDDLELKTFYLFILTSWLGLTVVNLWNAGIMLGFMWIFLAISTIKRK